MLNPIYIKPFHRLFLITLLILLAVPLENLLAQGPVITPLLRNRNLNGIRPYAPKRALNDTIQLPYMDDFTTGTGYPDIRFWADSQVYINHTFAVSPPSFGVATFDNLDKKGKPYQQLNGFSHNHSDSLTSRPINLKTYKIGLNNINYTPADSIYLSFFYQAQGFGDPSDGTDSLVLKFRNKFGFWTTVWKTKGSVRHPFLQVMIPVRDTSYLYGGFRYRFINYGKTTGNMNQFHIDYVRMKRSRNLNDTAVADMAINKVPVGPLLLYESMPYDHFKADPVSNTYGQHILRVHNNYIDTVNVQYKCDVYNRYNNLIKDYPLSSSAKNITGQSDSSESFGPFIMDTLSGKNPVLKLKYSLTALSFDYTSINFESEGNNNEFTKTVRFNNYLAYDDGTAEGGYGLDYGSLPSGPAFAAIKYTSFKPDTLRGFYIFFNRSVSDVEFKSFTFIIWKKISEPPASNTSGDIILKRIEMPTALYTDSINGFTLIVLDTAIALPDGNFYIGWQQNINFMLNIGYDNNYKYLHAGGRNPNLFYNMNGYWEKVNSTITGAVMLRPIFGEAIPNPSASVQVISTAPGLKIYPNPGNKELFIDSEFPIGQVKIYSLTGKLISELASEDIRSVDLSGLASGIWLIELTDNKGNIYRRKWIKQD